MREIEGANIIHKSDSDYNKDVVKMIKAARRARNPRDYIDYLGGVKDWLAIEERAEWQMEGIGNNKKEFEALSNTQTKENEIIENGIDQNIDLVVEEVVEEEEER